MAETGTLGLEGAQEGSEMEHAERRSAVTALWGYAGGVRGLNHQESSAPASAGRDGERALTEGAHGLSWWLCSEN